MSFEHPDRAAILARATAALEQIERDAAEAAARPRVRKAPRASKTTVRYPEHPTEVHRRQEATKTLRRPDSTPLMHARIARRLTEERAAEICGVSRRTFQRASADLDAVKPSVRARILAVFPEATS